MKTLTDTACRNGIVKLNSISTLNLSQLAKPAREELFMPSSLIMDLSLAIQIVTLILMLITLFLTLRHKK